MENNILEYIGKSLYQTRILKEWKRYVVFRVRCSMHKSIIDDILAFLMRMIIVVPGCMALLLL